MDVLVNNESVSLPEHATLADLVAFRQPEQPFALALNQAFIARVHYASTPLQAGDAIEIVRPVVGG